VKPLDEFYVYKGKPHSYCRKCQSLYNQEHNERKKVSGLTKGEFEELGPKLRGMVVEAQARKNKKH